MEPQMADERRPCVALTPAEVEQVRARAGTPPFERAADAVLQRAEAALSWPLDIPHEEGQWTHWYACEDDAARLRAEGPQRHVCPRCGRVYSGAPYDAAYVSLQHNRWLGAVQDLGAAYVIDPKPAYAQRIRDILVEYAGFYRDLELHDPHGGRGSAKARLYAQTLDEAVALCRLVQCYDLVYEAPCFSAEDHAVIEYGLLRPMASTIRANPRAVSNWQSWHNAAIGSVGFLLGDEGLVNAALNGLNGFKFQMERSVLPSGMWYEGAPIYHFYALTAHLYLLEAAARAGMPVYEPPVVAKLFEAPLRQMLPDGSFAPFNDSDRISLAGYRRLYEPGAQRFPDRMAGVTLEPREHLWALLWGPNEAPAGADRSWVSSNEPSEGLAALRNADNAIVALLDYGEPSGHVHPAKLGLVVYGHGDIRLVDPGRVSYGNPLHKEWFTQTVAHNAVVVDERSQRDCGGECVVFETGPGWSMIQARADGAYPGVTMERRVVLWDDALIDMVRCEAETTRTFDLPAHFRGELSDLPAGAPFDGFPDEAGYQHLTDVTRLSAAPGSFQVRTGKGRAIQIQMLGKGVFFRAKGLGPGAAGRLPMVLWRQEGRAAEFVTVYAFEGAVETSLEEGGSLEVFAGDGGRLRVAWEGLPEVED
jgi:hypothetical protein